MGGVLLWQGWYMRELSKTTVDATDLYHMLNTEPIIKQRPDAPEFQFKEGRIEFKNLVFKHYFAVDNPDYNPAKENTSKEGEENENIIIKERTLLNNFNLEIEPGTTNAIVGPSGFGKTTLFNLLFRIYDPEQGKILIDGQEVGGLQLKSFRKYISIVPQSGNLFNDTILYNLQYSNPEASMDEIIQVSKQC